MKWNSERLSDVLLVLTTMALNVRYYSSYWEVGAEIITSGSCKSEGLCCTGKDSTCVVQKMRATGRKVPAHHARGLDVYDAGLFESDVEEMRFEEEAGRVNGSGSSGGIAHGHGGNSAYEDELTPDTPCYCDAACLELRDCCGDYEEACECEYQPLLGHGVPYFTFY